MANNVICRWVITERQLKTTPRWLINETQLKERQGSEKRRRSTIVITVGNEAETVKLYAKRLRFRRAPKVVEKYWEAEPSLAGIICLGIGHD